MSLELDGKKILADAEASVASALVGAGEWILARSPKFHRPRGPSCMRGGCEGCLMRIDGAPNLQSCLVPATDGMRVERQNVALSPKLDVLRATDWFFPAGMNHHEIFAGVPGISQVMQAFARRISGLGELPTEARAAAVAAVPTATVDALVVGGGLSGLTVASALAEAGASVLLVDDRVALGGALGSMPPSTMLAEGDAVHDVDALLQASVARARAAGVKLATRTTAFGVLEGGDWLLDGPDGLVRADARARIVASGGHDGAALFGGNDKPGVVSARAAGRLLREGVLVGEAPLVVGEGPFATAFAAAAERHGAKPLRLADASKLRAARGLSVVKGAEIEDGASTRSVRCDAIVIEGPVAPAYELAREAGALLAPADEGFFVRVDANAAIVADPEVEGAAPAGVYAVGEVVASGFSVHRLLDDARAAAHSIAVALGLAAKERAR